MSNPRFMISPKLTETILKDCFGTPSHEFVSTEIYIGLGIEFDENQFVFTKEPVSKGFTIHSEICVFSEPTNGVIRNINAIKWPKAKQDWTTGAELIKYVGLYYKVNTSRPEPEYLLIAVVPLFPQETVHINETMVLNPNSIQLKLSNR